MIIIIVMNRFVLVVWYCKCLLRLLLNEISLKKIPVTEKLSFRQKVCNNSVPLEAPSVLFMDILTEYVIFSVCFGFTIIKDGESNNLY